MDSYYARCLLLVADGYILSRQAAATCLFFFFIFFYYLIANYNNIQQVVLYASIKQYIFVHHAIAVHTVKRPSFYYFNCHILKRHSSYTLTADNEQTMVINNGILPCDQVSGWWGGYVAASVFFFYRFKGNWMEILLTLDWCVVSANSDCDLRWMVTAVDYGLWNRVVKRKWKFLKDLRMGFS